MIYRRPRPRVPAVLLWVVLALIAYASLYPFDLQPQRLVDALQGPWLARMASARSTPVDVVANLFFYLPLGFVVLLRLSGMVPVALRIFVCTLFGLAVSFSFEVLQHATLTRTPSMLDVSLNTLSSAAGALFALWYLRIHHVWTISKWVRDPRIDQTILILALAWLSLHAAPFIPRMGLYRTWIAMETLRRWEWSVAGSALWFCRHLILATLLRIVVTRDAFWGVYAVALTGSLAAQVIFIQHHLDPDEVIGAIAALPVIALFRGTRTERTLGVVRWLAIVAYAVSALAPFGFSMEPHAFNWLPFTGVFESNVEDGFLSLTSKFFVFLGLLWTATRSGKPLLTTTIILFCVALFLELLQTYLPDRTAELTDPVLVLLTAAILAAAGANRRTHASGASGVP